MLQPSADSLDRIRDLYPIEGIVIVGAGNGADAILDMAAESPAAVLIEANPTHAAKLSELARGRNGWSVHSAVVSDENREIDFHIASNPNESSILSPMALVPLWKNLTVRHQDRRNAATLSRLIASSPCNSKHLNWMVVDCLPALPILTGAGELVLETDVLVLRVILDEHLLPKAGASKLECDLFLSSRGFRCIGVNLERQPMIGKALYIRDWKSIAKSGFDKLRARERSDTHANLENARIESESQAQRHRALQLTTEIDALRAEVQLLQLRSATLENAGHGLHVQLAVALASLDEKEAENAKLRSGESLQETILGRANDEIATAKQSIADLRETGRLGAEAALQAAIDLKEQQRQTNVWTQQVGELQCAATALTQSVAALKKENGELQQAVRISNKLQALSGADLSELRGRYEIALQAQDYQHGLLVELEGKLHAAARYFQQLRSGAAPADRRLIVGTSRTVRQPNNARHSKKTKDRGAT